jgi:hypothetical protein
MNDIYWKNVGPLIQRLKVWRKMWFGVSLFCGLKYWLIVLLELPQTLQHLIVGKKLMKKITLITRVYCVLQLLQMYKLKDIVIENGLYQQRHRN